MKNSAVERANLYRARANEIRNSADGMRDSESHAALLRLAEIYERLAGKIEQESDAPGDPETYDRSPSNNGRAGNGLDHSES